MGCAGRIIPWLKHGAVALVLACLPVFAADYCTEEVNTGMSRLVIRCIDRAMTDSMGFYAAKCSMLLDRVLGIHEPQDEPLCVQEAVEGEPRQAAGKERHVVFYSPAEDELDFVMRLLRQMLMRRLEQLTGKPAAETPFATVLVNGLAYRHTRGRNSLSGFYEPNYEVARNQFMRYEYPQLDILLKTRLAPDHPYFFELFMMHCDLLLQCIEGIPVKEGEVARKMLLAEQKGEEAIGVLDEMSRPYRGHDEALQKFYERMVLKMSRRRRRMSSEDVIAERVRELETVPMVGMEGKTALSRIPLEQVPEALKDYCNDVQGVLRLEARFRELRLMAPYLLRRSLEAYALALAWIREGDIKRFQREIAEARRQFRQALARQKKLNNLMDKYELEHIPALRRFQDFMGIQRHYRTIGQQLYPAGALGGFNKENAAADRK